MRIALLHSFYSASASSGENVVVLAQAEALERAGHDVRVISRHTDTDQAHLSAYPVRAAWRTLTSRGPNPGPLLAEFDPDVVHVHNTVPNIGLQWLPRWSGAVVHTLHNYRPLCANGLLFRDGHLCTLCPDGHPWAAVEHACYRESRVFTVPIATRNAVGIAHNPLINRADRLIVLSRFAQEVYTRYGVDPDRIRRVPNGIAPVHSRESAAPVSPRWVVIGRLSQEKGVLPLLQRWPAGQPLDIIGDGPLSSQVRRVAADHANVQVLGKLSRDELNRILPSYTGLVFPGLAPESALPLVVGEALEAGVPVLFATEHPQATPLVEAGAAVCTASLDSDPDVGVEMIDAALRTITGAGTAMRARARHWYDDHLTVDRWVHALIQVYREAMSSR